MKKLIFILFLCGCSLIQAQSGAFDLAAYRDFLAQTNTYSAAQLQSRYDAGRFAAEAPVDWQKAVYAASMEQAFLLTDAEKKILGKQGFMVSERLQYDTFMAALADVFHRDLPIFISADALLHSMHASYDMVLKKIELEILLPTLQTWLDQLRSALPLLENRYAGQSALQPMLHDIDLYISITAHLLDEKTMPYFATNQTAFQTLLDLIKTQQAAAYPLFGQSPRKIDFSQFQVRGHYTDETHPELGRYFQAMMWLGRTEFYLIAPKQLVDATPFADVQRQIIDALLLREWINLANTRPDYEKMDEIIAFLVGACDNVTLANLDELATVTATTAASDLLDSLKVVAFQDTLAQRPFASQRINSQMLSSHPLNPDSVVAASSFLLLGQRFIVDSYVTGQVVFDKIEHEGVRVTRMLPNPLDVLFALGNDAAAQLLQSDLEQYHYAPNLAAVRYLIDGYEDAFWRESLFNCWLKAIRGLNPPRDRTGLPQTLQTAAWWQRTMNTQLGSWTELRHDNLLYAKQSYSSMIVCSYPYAYLEPAPECYAALSAMAECAFQKFTAWNLDSRTLQFYHSAAGVFDDLAQIATRIRETNTVSEADARYLRGAIVSAGMCDPRGYDGWYPSLYLTTFDGDMGLADNLWKKDFLVADVHTAPTDEFGNLVGWVVHAGTGPINLGVIVLPVDGQSVAFAGPMYSYYEYLSTGFDRLTDEEWADLYQFPPSVRPEWTRNYLADLRGYAQERGPSLMTGVKKEQDCNQLPETPLLVTSHPNPFNSSTLIRFVLASDAKTEKTEVVIYDRAGREVAALYRGTLGGGNYLLRWAGTDNEGKSLPSGVYFYQLRHGSQVAKGKMSLIR